MNDWMQKQFGRFVPVGSFLATVYQIVDRRIATATPIGLAAPQNQGMRQMFQ